MTDNRIKVSTNEIEIIEAIEYMYGISFIEANRTLEEGKYTRDEIYRAIAWYRTRTEGLPHALRVDLIEKVVIKDVIATYESLI